MVILVLTSYVDRVEVHRIRLLKLRLPRSSSMVPLLSKQSLLQSQSYE
jgi:hypothetical protein